MAFFAQNLLFIVVYLFHQACDAVCYVSNEPLQTKLPCVYPKGSLRCKTWNYTNMDCSYRDLDCIPPIRQSSKLELLDLSHNKLQTLTENAFVEFRMLQVLNMSSNLISSIHVSAFTGLDKLHTLDLSSNYITCLSDDGFKELQTLQILNVSGNYLSTIGNRTFFGLSHLKTLDLKSSPSWNEFDILPGSAPFQDLASLQTLFVQYVTVTPATFVGIEMLQFLDILVRNMTTDALFVKLCALQYLRVKFRYSVPHNFRSYFSEKLFTGLERLEYLRIDNFIDEAYINITLCPLVSLKSLHLQSFQVNLSNACLQTIPLTSLDIFLYNTDPFLLPMFKHLSNLIYKVDDGYEAIRALKFIHSPLQKLTLQSARNMNLSTTSFQSWPKWKESLLELTILPRYTNDDAMWIIGSPFQWFTKLNVLRIRGFAFSSKIYSLSTTIFEGLECLTELHLTYTNIPGLLYRALGILGKYNSLRVLDMSHTKMYDPYDDVLDGICPISSLEILDLSGNGILNFYLPCMLPNLKIVHMGDENLPQGRPASLNLLCKVIGPSLRKLDLHNVGFVTFFALYGINCPELISLNVAQNKIIDVVDSKIEAPRLEELNLSGITMRAGNFTAIKLLTIFNTPELRIVDLSASQVSQIDEEDAALLANLTYLDLRNNQIASLNSLQHLRNVNVLLIGGNIFHIIPNFLISAQPSLNSVDLQDNLFECGCNIEEFRKWILTDKKVYLWNNASNGKRYKCDEPASRKGFSITEIQLDCESYLITYISVSAVCAVLALITLVILVVQYRWHIKYRLFLLFNRRANRNYLLNDDEVIPDDDEDGVPRYDAYVTYHREDEDWVDEELVANIEEGVDPFRLCLRTRDIRAGRLIFNELSLHIQRSRKILVILSPRFVNDNWCYFELNMAHHRVLEENRFVLIFIVLEDIPNNKLTLLLRQLFCRVQVIKWPADGRGRELFWQRLREELKRHVPLDRRFDI